MVMKLTMPKSPPRPNPVTTATAVHGILDDIRGRLAGLDLPAGNPVGILENGNGSSDDRAQLKG